MSKQQLKRSAASKLLGQLLVYAMENNDTHLQHLFQMSGLELPKRCDGEAHRNPYIDSCEICAPQWGWIGGVVNVI